MIGVDVNMRERGRDLKDGRSEGGVGRGGGRAICEKPIQIKEASSHQHRHCTSMSLSLSPPSISSLGLGNYITTFLSPNDIFDDRRGERGEF